MGNNNPVGKVVVSQTNLRTETKQQQEERGYVHIDCSLAQFGYPGYSLKQEILDELSLLNKSDEDSTEEIYIWNLSQEGVQQIMDHYKFYFVNVSFIYQIKMFAKIYQNLSLSNYTNHILKRHNNHAKNVNAQRVDSLIRSHKETRHCIM